MNDSLYFTENDADYFRICYNDVRRSNFADV